MTQDNRKNSPVFAQGLCFYKYVWVFMAASVIGVVVETVFCYVFTGEITSRKGTIFGPFNQIYGLAAIMLLLLLSRIQSEKTGTVFLVSALAGGAFEVVSSLVQEACFGSVSWDYTWMSVSFLGGRTNLLYMAFFGCLGVIYIRLIYPFLSRQVERIPLKKGALVSWGLVVFMSANLVFSGMAVVRWSERQAGRPPSSAVESYMDERYPDEILSLIYPSMKFADSIKQPLAG